MPSQTKQSELRPEFTVLMAVHNVEEYIRGTFHSLEKQSYPFSSLEIIIVDDGSQDESGKIARDFAAKHSNVKYFWQENSGPGAARKTALEHASGTWVTVVDPDDLLHENYFAAIADFLKRDTKSLTDLIISNIILMNGETASLTDKHPLNFRFKGGEQLVSLYDHPECIQLGATAFLRRENLTRYGLTYDQRIEPTFEDGNLLGRYLARTEKAVIGVVPDAKYLYRKRADQTSLVQAGWETQDRYTTVLKYGYLNMLEDVKLSLGNVPIWAQNMVLYDLMWYFKEDTRLGGRTRSLAAETKPQFLALLERIFEYIDVKTIEDFNLHPTWWTLKTAIMAKYKGAFDRQKSIYQWGPDSSEGGNSYSVIYRGTEPQIDIYLNGIIDTTYTVNYINYSFFDTYFMTEESVKVSSPGHVRVLVNGYKPSIVKAQKAAEPLIANSSLNAYLRPKQDSKTLLNRAVESIPKLPQREKGKLLKVVGKAQRVSERISVGRMALNQGTAEVIMSAFTRRVEKTRHAETARSLDQHFQKLSIQARSQTSKDRFRNAWIVLDRPSQADDNAEHFYRYLLTSKPSTNAWFLLEPESSDWNRLQREGFRLLPYGGDEAFLACANAQCVISSDAVEQVMYPAGKRYINYENSKFIFLQHGVIKDDLSKWLNGKRIDAIVTTTSQEYESFVGPNSPYKFRADQIVLTGLPRYDRLMELTANAERRYITVMATWRMHLRDELAKLEKPADRREHIRSSVFGKSWREYLHSPELKAIADEQGLEILYVAHPSMKPYLADMDLPSHVTVADSLELSFQEIIAATALYVTDYSSVAFDAAMIDVPVIYYQFDQGTFFSGHSYSPGYFDYYKDGFGPVTLSSTEAIEATRLKFAEPELEQIYDARRRHTFLYRDGKNCERVFNEIVNRIS